MASSVYDFIVVGGGPSGCSVASALARSPKKPSVLLLEAGGENKDPDLRVDGQRFLSHANEDMNWSFKTTPQKYCDNREVGYHRGRGLGGSSAINYGVYSICARDDYDEWARLVGDDSFSWDNIQPRLKALETFHGKGASGVDAKYAAPKPEDHGTSGPLNVGFPLEWEREILPMLDLCEEAGFPLSQDHNSGNPIGMSILINSSAKGRRSTAADLLQPSPENLTILTSSPIRRILMEDRKAVGVKLDSKEYWASKEIVLSAGSLDSPKILMHSRIGPRNQLEEFGI